MNTSFTAVRISRSTLRSVVIASVTLAVLSLLLWFQGNFDRDFLLAHNQLRDSPAVVAICHALSRFGMSALCLLLFACVVASFRFTAFQGVRPILPVVLLSFAAAALAGTLLKELAGRARPIAELAGQLDAVAMHGTASFPSGHAAKSLALALSFVLTVPGGSVVLRLVKLALLLIASLVCYSRIVLGAHYLSDVLAGAALALACVPLAVAVANGIYSRGKVTPEKLSMVTRRASIALLGLSLLLPFL